MMSPLKSCKMSHGDDALVGNCLGGSVGNGTGMSWCPTGYSCGSGYELKGGCCVPVTKKASVKSNKIVGIAVVVLVIYLITKK